MYLEGLAVIAGVILILAIADFIVKSSIKLSKHFGLSGTFIGLTILSIGTSIPEIMSAIVGGFKISHNPDLLHTLSGLVIGQNVGSDIFQQSFILALVGIIGTIIVVRKNLYKEMGALIIGAVIVWLFALNGMISRFEGFMLVVVYAGYLAYLTRNRDEKSVKPKNQLSKEQVFIEISSIVVAFILMGFIADAVLEHSTNVVASLPISASFFGVILLGIASALPELTTALIAVVKKRNGISAGVLIGSNITNPMLGLGLGSLISGFAVPDVVLYYDMPFKIGTAFLIFYFLWKHQDLKKWQGLVLILLFLAFLFVRQMYFPVDF